MTVQRQADSLANYLPSGRVFAAKKIPGTVTRRLLEGLAGELDRGTDLIAEFKREVLPDLTTLFLDEWESAVGIPDDCFSGAGSDAERRRDVQVKLASLGLQTAEDFVMLAALLGLDVTVEGGSVHGTFPMEFPIIFFPSEKAARFTIVVNFAGEEGASFPYTFPIPFSTPELILLECLFRELKPANCDLLFTSFTA